MPSPDQTQRLDSKKVLAHIQKHKHFSSKQVARRFRVRLTQAVAAIAILRIKEVVEPGMPPDPDDKDQSSRWIYTG
jgi:hypothetical protein